MIREKQDKYKTTDFKNHSFEFYTLLGLIVLAIIVSIVGMIFIIITWNKVNNNSAVLELGAESLRINEIDICINDCNSNLCLWEYNTLECLESLSTLQLGCRTKEQCYSICVEWYKNNVDRKCFGN